MAKTETVSSRDAICNRCGSGCVHVEREGGDLHKTVRAHCLDCGWRIEIEIKTTIFGDSEDD